MSVNNIQFVNMYNILSHYYVSVCVNNREKIKKKEKMQSFKEKRSLK